jgi:hypothetical protein
MNVKPILNTAVALESVALLSGSYKLAKKKKKRAGDLINTGVGIVVGSALIKSQSDFINS